MMKSKPAAHGFTLVELAIVMVIIGVLLGGVLKGQELITNAKASATIADIKSYEAAVNTFQDAYDAIPGDMQNAMTRLPNCLLNTTCGAAQTQTPVTLGDRRLNEGPGEGADTEMTGFFAQLAAADLTGAVDPTVWANRGTIYSWETGVWPESPIGGGFHAGWTDGVNANGFPQIEGTEIPRRGLWLLLHDAPGSGVSGGSRNPRILQPSHALRIDTKMDNGRPDTGFVRGANGACVNTATGDYNGSITEPQCFLYIRLGG